MANNDGNTADIIFNSNNGLTYDDFIILPGFIDFNVEDVSLETNLTKTLKIKNLNLLINIKQIKFFTPFYLRIINIFIQQILLLLLFP